MKQYQFNPLPSESEVENNLQNAEFRAAQKKRRQEPNTFGKKKFKHGYSDSANPVLSNVVFPSWSQGATGVGPVGHPIHQIHNQSFHQQPGQSGSNGLLFLLWELHAPEKRVPLY